MDNTTFFTILLSVVGLGGGIAVAIYAMTISVIDRNLARRSVLVAWASAEILCIWYGGTNDMERWVRYSLAGVIAGVLTVGLCAALDHINEKAPSGEKMLPPAISAPLAQRQLDKLEEINKLICQKDEGQLQEDFDYQRILKFNIIALQKQFVPELVSSEDSESLKDFLVNASSQMPIANVKRTPKVGESISDNDLQRHPHTLLFMTVSQKHILANANLTRIAQDAELPERLQTALNDYQNLISRNAILVINTLNEHLWPSANSVMYNYQPGSEYHLSTSRDYWNKFEPLRPQASVLCASIRQYLRVE